MRTLILFLALFISVPSLLAQSTATSPEDQMNSLFQQKKYYQLLSAQEQYFQKYPEVRNATSNSWIMAQRMYAWLFLYDFVNLQAELKAVDAVNPSFIGMEHQGAVAIGTVYNSEYHHIDIPNYDMLMVHETAHEWWGNTVAFGDMADAWISEGFATYAEWMFIEKEFGYQKYLEAAGTYTRNVVNAWPIVGDRDVNDNNFVTGDIYFKGAAMLHNLRCILNNDSLFFRMIKGFYEAYRMKITNTNDFEVYVKNSCPADLTAFLETFLYQDTPPVLEYSFALAGGALLLDYRWTGVPKGFSMPFCIVVNDNECIRLTATTAIQHYTHKGAGSFYIPTPFNFKADILKPNSFTYFQTHYLRN